MLFVGGYWGFEGLPCHTCGLCWLLTSELAVEDLVLLGVLLAVDSRAGYWGLLKAVMGYRGILKGAGGCGRLLRDTCSFGLLRANVRYCGPLRDIVDYWGLSRNPEGRGLFRVIWGNCRRLGGTDACQGLV